MNVDSIFIPILKIAMIAVRVSSLWFVFPVLSQSVIPPLIRLSGALTLSVALYSKVSPLLPAWTLDKMPENYDILLFVLRESFVGIGMGIVARWMFGACISSAQWISTQMGFSVSGLFDPEFQNSESAWSEFNQWILVMIFFSVGGHLFFIRAIADSYSVDLSQMSKQIFDINHSLEFWAEIGKRFFTWMLKLSGPMAVVLLLLQISMGILSKFVPQVNIWSVSLPMTLGVGVLIFTLLSPMYGDALSNLLKVNIETNYLWLKYLGAH